MAQGQHLAQQMLDGVVLDCYTSRVLLLLFSFSWGFLAWFCALLYWHGVVPIKVRLVSTLASRFLVVWVFVDVDSSMYRLIGSCHY